MHGKRVPVALPDPTTFVDWGIRATELILYTSHLLPTFNLGRAPVKFNGRNSSFDVGLAGSVGNSILYL